MSKIDFDAVEEWFLSQKRDQFLAIDEQDMVVDGSSRAEAYIAYMTRPISRRIGLPRTTECLACQRRGELTACFSFFLALRGREDLQCSKLDGYVWIADRLKRRILDVSSPKSNVLIRDEHGNTVDPQRLRRTLGAIVGERSPFSSQRHLTAVESFIEKELGNFGLKVENDYFSYRGKTFRNIIGRQGDQRGGSLIILGAHFDSVQGTPGADDNASGVAVLLEAARLLARARVRSQVLFCAFNLEELNMIGSGYFAQKLKSAGAKVDGHDILRNGRLHRPKAGQSKVSARAQSLLSGSG